MPRYYQLGTGRTHCVTKGRYVVERTANVITERLLCLQADSVSLEEADNRIVTHEIIRTPSGYAGLLTSFRKGVKYPTVLLIEASCS